MNKIKQWHNGLKAKRMADILTKKHYDVHSVETLDEAKRLILSMIPEGASVALGGSTALGDMGFVEEMRNGKYKFFDRYEPGKKFIPDVVEIHRQSLLADYYLTGTNAVTENGELVNIDCTGNRVAAMIFGPKRVIIVVGVNKFVKDIDAAFVRLREIAPLNVKRIGHTTPCAETGKCEDCDCKGRMCNYTTIIHNGWKFEGRISVVIVADDIGF